MAEDIPSCILSHLSDNLHDNLVTAAVQIGGIVNFMFYESEHEESMDVIRLLADEYICSPFANYRKGGLLGLASVTIGLASEAALGAYNTGQPVLSLFGQDNIAQYHAYKALYNIAKVLSLDMIVFFDNLFHALGTLSANTNSYVQSAEDFLDRIVQDTEADEFSTEEFIQLLRGKMNVLKPFVHQFLVEWITVLKSVPDFDMLDVILEFLYGLCIMLSDPSHDVQQKANSSLSEFSVEITNFTIQRPEKPKRPAACLDGSQPTEKL